MWLWLVNSRLGQWVSGAVALVTVLAVVLWRAYTAGKSAVREQNKEAIIKAFQKRKEVEDDVQAKRPAARRDALREWVSDE